MYNHSLVQKNHKVIIKTLTDVTEPEELKYFFKSYSKLVKKHQEEESKLIVLIDIRSLTITLLTPKLQVLKAITDFFINLKPFSEKHVAAVAIILSDENIAKIMRASIEIYPSKVKTTISHSLDHCKKFLKNSRVLK
jgi:hypothetical protein